MVVIVASRRTRELEDFLQTLIQEGGGVLRVDTPEEALNAAAKSLPALVLLDEPEEGSAAEAVQDLLRVNAMINTAVFTRLSPREFHEAYEGLGVLKGLPLTPGPEDARELMETLNRLM